jgi:succinate dehydrogenase/fumarate reductase cytochrome b subunit
MDRTTPLIAHVGLAEGGRASRWPARLDLAQSASGLLLVLFMWAHMFFVSSILLGSEAMWTVTKFFEGYYLFGRSYPVIVSVAVALVLALLVVHAVLATRKFPGGYRQYRAFRSHMRMMRHDDTTLWFWQAFTGVRAVLPRVDAPLRDARAPRPHRPVRVRGPRVERALLAAVHPAPARRRAARRHRPLPPRREVGLARLARPGRDAPAPEAPQVGDHRVLPRARLRHARRLRQDRHRARRPRRRALRPASVR